MKYKGRARGRPPPTTFHGATGMPLSRLAIEHSIATITFNRDDKRNAFNHAMSRQTLSHFDAAERERCRVIILRANPGAKVWCSGHDLTDLKPGEDPYNSDNPMIELFSRIQEVPMPVMTMVEGSVYAGGLLLNMVADIAIASVTTEVAMTANRIGIPFIPEIYAYWLKVTGLHKTKELFFTAAPISARDAYAAGIFNHVVEAGDLERTTLEMAGQILRCSAEAVANSKYQLNLLAACTDLSEEELKEIERGRQKILKSPETQKGLACLIQRLRGNETPQGGSSTG